MQTDDDAGSLRDGSCDGVVHDRPAWPPVPTELAYLIEPAIDYGRKYRFDNDVQWFLENAAECDFRLLAALAERARICGDYIRLMQWLHDVDDVSDRIVDEHYPYAIDISGRRDELLRLINEANDPPGMAERWREKRLLALVEADDRSDVAERRKEMRMRLLAESNDKVHHMDVYFLFGLMDACDMKFE
jgi:hypothetical protein